MGQLSHEQLDTQTTYASASRNVDFNPPSDATAAVFFWRISAVAGTTPIADCKLQYKDPTSGQYIDVDGGAFAQQTAASFQALSVGQGLTADATGNFRVCDGVLIPQMRFVFTFDRTTGDETYTYTLSASYSG